MIKAYPRKIHVIPHSDCIWPLKILAYNKLRGYNLYLPWSCFFLNKVIFNSTWTDFRNPPAAEPTSSTHWWHSRALSAFWGWIDRQTHNIPMDEKIHHRWNSPNTTTKLIHLYSTCKEATTNNPNLWRMTHLLGLAYLNKLCIPGSALPKKYIKCGLNNLALVNECHSSSGFLHVVYNDIFLLCK